MWYRGFPQYDRYEFLPYYLTGIGKHGVQPPIYRPYGLSRHQFLYCENGRGILKINEKEICIEPHCGFYIPPDVPHEYYPIEDVWDIRWISCGGAGMNSLCELMNLKAGTAYHLDNVEPLDKLLKQIYYEKSYDERGQEQTADYYMASSYVNTFVVEFCRQAHLITEDRGTSDIYKQHFEILQDYIEHNYMRDIPIDEMCSLLSVTPQHLCRIFKKCVMQRPTEYINEVRLRYAKELLAESNYPIKQIALWCGYESINYFGKLFKKSMGMTPKEYRRRQVEKI